MILYPVILHDFCTNWNILFLNIMQWMKTTCISKVFIKRLLCIHEGWLKKVENDAINKMAYKFIRIYIIHILYSIYMYFTSVKTALLCHSTLWHKAIAFEVSKVFYYGCNQFLIFQKQWKKNPTPNHTKQNLRFVLCLETLWKRFWSNYSCSVNLFSAS